MLPEQLHRRDRHRSPERLEPQEPGPLAWLEPRQTDRHRQVPERAQEPALELPGGPVHRTDRRRLGRERVLEAELAASETVQRGLPAPEPGEGWPDWLAAR